MSSVTLHSLAPTCDVHYTNTHAHLRIPFPHWDNLGLACLRVRRPMGMLKEVSLIAAEKTLYRIHIGYRCGMALLVGSANGNVVSTRHRKYSDD